MRMKGATIVEVLIAACAMGMLVCLVLPALAQARLGSRDLACVGILQQIGYANAMYADASNEWYVPMRDHSRSITADDGTQHDASYWPQNPLFCSLMGYEAESLDAAWYWPEQYICPNATEALEARNEAGHYEMWLSYGMNGLGLWQTGILLMDNPTRLNGYQRSRIGNPSQALACIDSIDWFVHPRYTEPGARQRPELRHIGQTANAVFFDGHLEPLSAAQLFDPDLPAAENHWVIQGYTEEDPYILPDQLNEGRGDAESDK